jgi:predicted DCC family thiol-disulfide oxidoreductase YuxK
MLTPPRFPLRVFYDGACAVCADEIEHYRRKDQAGRLVPVDISAADFDPQPYGITLSGFMFELHVIDREGTIYRGVDAFWAIWQAFPASPLFGLLGTLVTLPLLRPLARFGYRSFARLRPYLPKRHSACASGSCRSGRH